MAYSLNNPNIVEIHGVKFVMSKKPCKRAGHIGLHHMTGMCAECAKERSAEQHKKKYQKSTRCLIQKTPEYLAKKAEEEQLYKKKWYANNKQRLIRESTKRVSTFRKKEPYYYLVQKAKARAFKKGWEFNLTNEWAKARWTGKCELTGIEFRYFDLDKVGYFYSASIDRIDSAKGYTEDNCRFILYAINIMKGKASDADIFLLSKALVEVQKL